MRDHASPQSPGAAPLQAAWAWLAARLNPRGDNVLMVSVYVAIILTMVTMVLGRAMLGTAGLVGTLLTLSAMFVLHALLPDIERRVGEPRAHSLHLLLNGALFIAASWFGLSGNTFLPYLLFILTGEAIVMLASWRSLAYSLALLTAWIAVLWFKGADAGMIRDNVTAVGLGMLFTALFCVVILGYNRQRQHAEALLRQLQAANAELAAAREREKDLAVADERVRLAREIHDGLGHHLTVLNVQLQAAEKLIERDPERAAGAIKTSRNVAQAAMEEVRQSVAVMRQSPLDGRTLDETIGTLVREFDQRSALTATVTQHGALPALPPAVAMTLYRAAQEGLTNAQKHAQATRADVQLICDDAHVRLSVRDNGRGATTNGAGFGLAGLRERAAQLGGRMRAETHPEGGFELWLELPVGNAEF